MKKRYNKTALKLLAVPRSASIWSFFTYFRRPVHPLFERIINEVTLESFKVQAHFEIEKPFLDGEFEACPVVESDFLRFERFCRVDPADGAIWSFERNAKVVAFENSQMLDQLVEDHFTARFAAGLDFLDRSVFLARFKNEFLTANYLREICN